jgi:hypothetical protein
MAQDPGHARVHLVQALIQVKPSSPILSMTFPIVIFRSAFDPLHKMTEKTNSQSPNAMCILWYLGGFSTNYIFLGMLIFSENTFLTKKPFVEENEESFGISWNTFFFSNKNLQNYLIIQQTCAKAAYLGCWYVIQA